MIKHIVMWKFKDYAEGNEKKTNIRLVKEKLILLKNTIKVIENIEVGINFSISDAAYDLVLYTEFEDLRALETYKNHPDHLLVAEFIAKVRDERAVVDYEI